MVWHAAELWLAALSTIVAVLGWLTFGRA